MTYPSIGLIFSSMVAVLALTNCQDQTSEVSLSIRTRTSEGETLPGASVKVNGEAKGTTDAEGIFTTNLKLPIAQQLQVQVEKQSDEYYYSPHEEVFVVKDVAVQDISVAAVLYFVPKPGTQQQQMSAQEASKPEPAKPIEEDFDASTPEESQLLNFPDQDKKEAPKPIAETDPAKPTVATSSEKKIEAIASEEIPPLVAVAGPVNEPVTDSKIAKKADSTEAQIFSIYTYFNKEDPVTNAKILIGEEGSELKTLCQTNARGRCVAEFGKMPQQTVTLVAKAEGFITKTAAIKLKADGSYRFDLQPGHAIDFFALEKRFHRHKGIAGSEILINGKLAGKTNKFGHFTYKHTGPETDFITAEINVKNYLPETYATDFVAAGEMQVKRSFTPLNPPNPAIAIIPTLTAGNLNKQKMSGDEFQALAEKINRELISAFNHQAAFKVIPVETILGQLNTNFGNLETLKSGWQKTSIDSQVDNIIIPTLIIGDRIEIEVNLINNQGKTIAVAKEPLPELNGNLKLNQTFDKILSSLVDLYPFEGAILKNSDENYVINLGAESSRGIKTGQMLTVIGTQLDKNGRGEETREIAKLKIVQTFSQESVAQVVSMEPRASIRRGDAIVMTRVLTPSSNQQVMIRVKDAKTQEPINHANLYLNDQWLASTDGNGQLYVAKNIFSKAGVVKILKHGYEETNHSITVNQGNLDLTLVRKYAGLKISTQPPGANVYINGVLVGKSPIANPVPVPNGFVTLEISAGDQYKHFRSNLEINQDIVDFSGQKKIILEENLLEPALDKIKNNDIDTALNMLGRIGKEHSDYLFAQHQIGELMLGKKRDAEAAIAAFSKVLENEEVAKFINKQFIGTHINMALALYQLAEKQGEARSEKALQALGQAVQILDQVSPQLRFVPKDQYLTAKNNVDYYKNLAKHRVWLLTNDALVLEEVTNGWKDYLEEHKADESGNASSKTMLDNANVYYRQASASSKKPIQQKVNL